MNTAQQQIKKPVTFVVEDLPSAERYTSFSAQCINSGMRFKVTFEEDRPDRKTAQNRLMWHWNGEVCEQHGNCADWVHGYSKLTILLPLMKAWGGKRLDRAQHLESVLGCVPLYKNKVSVAYDMVRTRDLNIKEFTAYLNEYQRYWAGKGVHLTTSEDLYFEAMGVKR